MLSKDTSSIIFITSSCLSSFDKSIFSVLLAKYFAEKSFNTYLWDFNPYIGKVRISTQSLLFRKNGAVIDLSMLSRYRQKLTSKGLYRKVDVGEIYQRIITKMRLLGIQKSGIREFFSEEFNDVIFDSTVNRADLKICNLLGSIDDIEVLPFGSMINYYRELGLKVLHIHLLFISRTDGILKETLSNSCRSFLRSYRLPEMVVAFNYDANIGKNEKLLFNETLGNPNVVTYPIDIDNTPAIFMDIQKMLGSL